MASTLFGSAVPAILNADDGNTYVLGTAFTPDVDGTITHLRRYFPTTGQAGVSQGLYRDSDQALIGSVSWPDGTAAGWQQMALASPVAVTAGQTYQTTYFTPSKYTATAAYGFPFTSGDLTAIAANGKFNASVPALQFATGSLSGTAVFADVVFEPDGAVPGVTPDGLAVPVGLGSPAIGSTAVAPAGLSVPVGLGEPAVSAGVRPEGIAVAVTFGLPTLVGADPEPVPSSRARGWESYGRSLRYNAEQERIAEETPPTGCPVCGERLDNTPRGLHCPAGHVGRELTRPPI